MKFAPANKIKIFIFDRVMGVCQNRHCMAKKITKKFLKNTFSFFFDREIFTAIIAGLIIIGFISWLHVSKSIQKDLNARLDYEAKAIASALEGSLKTYALSLTYTRSHFDSCGVPEATQFKKFTKSVKAQSPAYSLIDLKYAPKDKILALITSLPQDQQEDILSSLHNPTVTMTYPIEKPVINGDPSKEDFTIALAISYAGKGLIYIPISLNDLVDSIFGKPNLQKSLVNFSLIQRDIYSGKEKQAYTRFANTKNESTLTKSREITLYGKTWVVAVSALPNFFTHSDRYLSFVVILATVLVIILLFSLFRQFENAAAHENKERALLEESSRMKSAFLANMSHEIRTPLNAITGYSEILGRTESAQERQLLVDNIRKNSSQLTSIIDNILDISNIEFGKISLNSQRLSLKKLFSDVLFNMNNRANSKGIQFNIITHKALPEYIQAAESRVKQILINLIGNAIKFTEKGSVTVEIDAEINPLGLWYLIVTVKDTGIGISKHDQAELFKSFSQVDDSHTRRFGGVGLGLAVSKRMAQQFNGDVHLIESRLGRGSTFQLKIPCGDIARVAWQENLLSDIIQLKASGHMHMHNKARLAGQHILIVEDSEDNQDIFKFFLQSVGAVTEVVDNGIAAVRKARECNYDLILMDIQLPQMDGLEATRRIRIEGFKNPIIALTAHASPEEKASCFEAGCIGLITKPVSQETLIQQILEITQNLSKNTQLRKVALKPKETYDRNYANPN